MRILVIDADGDARRRFFREGRRFGHSVAAIDRGREAAVLAESFRADGIVLSRTLADGDGRDVLASIRRRRQLDGVPVFFTAPVVDEFLRRTCLDLGARDVAENPVEPEMVFRRMSHWTG